MRPASVPIRTPSKRATHDFVTSAEVLRGWLMRTALPIWASEGADWSGWGFHEVISTSGAGSGIARRARVQARQLYSFSMAGVLGWEGPWRELLRKGLPDFEVHYRRPDGLFRTMVGVSAENDDTPMLYDQAFVLLAFAYSADVFPGVEGRALQLLGSLERAYAHDGQGFRENAANPYQSNPHMHLLEACLAWMKRGGSCEWKETAHRLVSLALDQFIDRDSGMLREFFTSDWAPAAGESGRLVEPGHQYEWAWLLMHWYVLTADACALRAAERLVQVGDLGLDLHRNVVVNMLRDDGSTASGAARLWPQTERLKAKLGLWSLSDGNDRLALQGEVLSAINGLQQYFNTPISGLWFDKMLPDGRFVDEPAPASSLYHIVCAIEQLCLAAQHGSIFQTGPERVSTSVLLWGQQS